MKVKTLNVINILWQVCLFKSDASTFFLFWNIMAIIYYLIAGEDLLN